MRSSTNLSHSPSKPFMKFKKRYLCPTINDVHKRYRTYLLETCAQLKEHNFVSGEGSDLHCYNM